MSSKRKTDLKVIEGIGRQSGDGECGYLFVESGKSIELFTGYRKKKEVYNLEDAIVEYEELFPSSVSYGDERFKFKISIELEVIK